MGARSIGQLSPRPEANPESTALSSEASRSPRSSPPLVRRTRTSPPMMDLDGDLQVEQVGLWRSFIEMSTVFISFR